jgi:hypothetical protein
MSEIPLEASLKRLKVNEKNKKTGFFGATECDFREPYFC